MNDHESSAAAVQEFDDSTTERKPGDGLRDEQEFSGAATSALLERTPESPPAQTITASHEADQAAIPVTEGEEAAVPVTGFGPFRLWANTQIRRRTKPPIMNYGGELYSVTELTPEGHLRLQIEERFVNVPFDERFIPKLLEQIL